MPPKAFVKPEEFVFTLRTGGSTTSSRKVSRRGRVFAKARDYSPEYILQNVRYSELSREDISDVRRTLRVKQSNKCAICRDEIDDGYLDHCHTTDRVRGVLCRGCNTGLGYFRDKVSSLVNAERYLASHYGRLGSDVSREMSRNALKVA